MADDEAPAPIWTPPPATRRNGKPKRPNRWDRPPEPHDWRWVVGHIGRALITLGLLMFGFVAYQLWGTGIQTARAQNELDDEFDSFFEENSIVPDTLGPPMSTTVTTSVVPETSAPQVSEPTVPAETVPAETAPAETVPATTPETAAPPSTEPVVQNYGDIDPGDALLQLTIPRLDFNWKVVAGVSAKDLAKGPGHFADTPLPGQLGNAAIAGHRTGHGGPFIDLDRLQPGDEIQVRTRLGDAYAYIVTGSEIVTPDDYDVIATSDPTVATLTLVTCDPKYTSKKRLVVHATLDTTRGSPVGAPLIFYGQDEPIPVEPILPSDETLLDTTVNTNPATSVTTAETATATVASEPTASSVAGGAAGSDPTLPTASSTPSSPDTLPAPEADEFAGEDAFSQGWFDDTAAWPHVIGWALLLGAVAYAAYRLAKRYRRLYLAFAVGFVPFLVVLYFFYENVNRLLPAAI